MIIEKVDEETSLFIMKSFEMQSCVHEFHFFQNSWQPKLGEILNASNEDEPSSLVHDRYAIACKDKNGKTVGMLQNMCRSKCISSLSTKKEWKCRRMANSDIQKTCIKEG